MAQKDNYTFITVPKDPWVGKNSGKRFTLRQLQTAVRNPQNTCLSHAIRELGLRPSGHVAKFIRVKILQYGLSLRTSHWLHPVTYQHHITPTPKGWELLTDRYEAPAIAAGFITANPVGMITTDKHRASVISNPRTTAVNKKKLEQSARLFLEAIGEDLNRDGLKDTPKRYANYMADIMGGKFIDTSVHQKDFENDGGYNGPVVVTNMPFYTICEHHLAPFIGTWDFAYKPKDRILGLSKVVRLAREFQKQPQVQERLTQQIAKKMFDVLNPEWVVVRMGAEHFCMSTRGVRTPGAKTFTRQVIRNRNGVSSNGDFLATKQVLPIPTGE